LGADVVETFEQGHQPVEVFQTTMSLSAIEFGCGRVMPHRCAAIRDGSKSIWNIFQNKERKTVAQIPANRIGTGIDWWLGTEDDLFQHKARLEVSGHLKATRSSVASRVSLKKKQTKQSDGTCLTAT